MPTGLAGEHDPHAVLSVHGDQVCPVLGHSGPIIDENDLEAGGVPAGAGLAEGAPGGLLENLAVPATVGRAGFFESAVGLLEVASVGAGIAPVVPPTRDEPARGEHDHHDGKRGQDYGQG